MATLVVGVVVLVVFALYGTAIEPLGLNLPLNGVLTCKNPEIYMPLKSPLIPMSLFKIGNYNVVVIVGSVGQMSFYALNIIWPQQITNLYTTDNIKIGWMSVSFATTIANTNPCLYFPSVPPARRSLLVRFLPGHSARRTCGLRCRCS